MAREKGKEDERKRLSKLEAEQKKEKRSNATKKLGPKELFESLTNATKHDDHDTIIRLSKELLALDANDHPEILNYKTQAQINLGSSLMSQGKLEEAESNLLEGKSLIGSC
jgi:hypothetical protein